MNILMALLIPLAVLLLAVGHLVGGRAAQAMAIAALVLSAFAMCLVLVNAT